MTVRFRYNDYVDSRLHKVSQPEASVVNLEIFSKALYTTCKLIIELFTYNVIYSE